MLGVSASAVGGPERAFVRLTFTPEAADTPEGARAADAPEGGAPLPPAVTTDHWLVPFKSAVLPRAAPRVVRLRQLSPTSAEVHLATNVTAAFVSVECWKVVGAFSDGAFTLLAGAPPLALRFEARRAFALAELAEGLRVRSLRDTYE